MRASEDDLIYMIGELYAQRRMEQTRNQQLVQHNEALLAELQAQKQEEGGEDDVAE